MGAIERLVACGPPDEWSGTIAGSLGPDGRRELIALWKSMSTEERREVREKWAQSMDKKATRPPRIRPRPHGAPAAELQGTYGKVKGVYRLLTTEDQRKKVESTAESAPVVGDALRAKKKVEKKVDDTKKFVIKHAEDPRLAPFLSKEKRRARKSADRHLKAETPDWNAFLGSAERKSFVQAIQKDSRSDKKLHRHVDQMNRLMTGKVLDTIAGRSGTYEIRRLRGGGVGCTCPDWRYRGSVAGSGEQDCRHVRAWKFRSRHEKKAGTWADGEELISDTGADLMEDALDQMDVSYTQSLGRAATSAEKQKTLSFVLRGKEAGADLQETHQKLDEAGVRWDSNPSFMEFCQLLVGEEHLDRMSPAQRREVVEAVRHQERKPGDRKASVRGLSSELRG